MLTTDITFSENLDEMLTRFSQIHDCALLVHCKCGKMQIEINEQSHLIEKNDLLLCRPDLIIGNYMRSPDMECYVIAIRKHALDDILYVCMREDNKWWEKAQYILQHPIVHLDERQQEIGQLFSRLFQLFSEDSRSGLSENIRRVFMQAIVFELLNWLEGSIETPEEEPKQSRLDILFRDFVKLLQETKGRQREVRWFAAQLAVSPKYLSVACHAVAGKPAQAVINEMCVQEIKRLLRQTDRSVKEICALLNFPSLSFFCKYTKQHLGMTANEYRKKTI